MQVHFNFENLFISYILSHFNFLVTIVWLFIVHFSNIFGWLKTWNMHFCMQKSKTVPRFDDQNLTHTQTYLWCICRSLLVSSLACPILYLTSANGCSILQFTAIIQFKNNLQTQTHTHTIQKKIPRMQHIRNGFVRLIYPTMSEMSTHCNFDLPNMVKAIILALNVTW